MADTRPLSAVKAGALNQSPSPLSWCQATNLVAVGALSRAKKAKYPPMGDSTVGHQGLLSVWDLRTPQQRGFKGPQGLWGVCRQQSHPPRLPEHLEGPRHPPLNDAPLPSSIPAQAGTRGLLPSPCHLPGAEPAPPPSPTRGPQAFLNPPVRSSLPHTLLCMENAPARFGPDAGLWFC